MTALLWVPVMLGFGGSTLGSQPLTFESWLTAAGAVGILAIAVGHFRSLALLIASVAEVLDLSFLRTPVPLMSFVAPLIPLRMLP